MKDKDETVYASRGMTLLEVMVALLFFSVGIMAVAAMINISILSNVKAQTNVEDTVSAAMMMEQILALDYDDPRLEDRDDGFFPQNPDHGPVQLRGRWSTIEWEVDRGFPAGNTKRVHVTVRDTRSKIDFQGHRYDYVKTKNLTYVATKKENE